jgi:lipoprotein-anchoring transpeptidase ErfK/SrfK
MRRVGGHEGSNAARRLWRIALLAAAGATGATSEAGAALYYWSGSDPGYYRPAPSIVQPRQPARHRQSRKNAVPEKGFAKPQGPLIIAISIQKQSLKIYDANGLFAETPISTGMKGHPTPMGVFSVIQKQRFHRSNIYSDAPMPYMQRITWSGVAMHAGVLPGYPASHGCIRMPMAFAVKMWNWTRMGARVVVTPGEMAPSSFSHPLLPTERVLPQPTAARAPVPDAPVDAPVNAKADEQTRTADAAGNMPATDAPTTMSDSAPPRDNASSRDAVADASSAETKSEVAKTDDESAAMKPGESASSDGKPVGAASPETKTGGTKRAETETSASPATNTSSHEAAKVEPSATGSVKTDTIKVEAKTDEVKPKASKPDAPKSSERADGDIKAAADSGASVPVNTDQARSPEIKKMTVSKPDPATAAAAKRAGQIAVFISRKDSKLYVRQNFAPLFEAPVTIAPSDRPLGTHVFTAQVDKGNADVLHWSVVSLPVPSKYQRRGENDRASRRLKIADPVEMKEMPPPDSPAEALDRLTIPADAMARITEALSTGGSIIVSDQGIKAGETGEGTDFIVSLR